MLLNSLEDTTFISVTLANKNRGFCHEREGCSYGHPKEEFRDQLNGGCTKKGCNSLRHRRPCRYIKNDSGCHRGSKCEYLRSAKKVAIDNELHTVKDKKVQRDVFDTEEKNSKITKWRSVCAKWI